jgi:tripartite-type tricarboxylate transporter receptor subunit TctC
MTHLTAEQFKILAGIEMTHVNYRGGTPALNDVLSGQIPMTWRPSPRRCRSIRPGWCARSG